jgi:DNA-binding MarR family transcriptional regulator
VTASLVARREKPCAGACAAGLRQLGSLISAELDRNVRRQGFSSAAFGVLQVLHESGGWAAPHQLSDRLAVSRATVTGLLDGLERRRLVRRVRHPSDRRMLRVEMTDRARVLLAEMLPEHNRAVGRIFAGLGPLEQQQLVSLLNRLQTHLRPVRPGLMASRR